MLETLKSDVLDDRAHASAADERRTITPWRSTQDPFAGAVPITRLSLVAGGLPDDRQPAEILADLCERTGAEVSRR